VGGGVDWGVEERRKGDLEFEIVGVCEKGL
jgi:hypothetical protein